MDIPELLEKVKKYKVVLFDELKPGITMDSGKLLEEELAFLINFYNKNIEVVNRNETKMKEKKQRIKQLRRRSNGKSKQREAHQA